MSFIDLIHFKPEEFGDGWGKLDIVLLLALDSLRSLIGVPVVIHKEGIVSSRAASPDSQHPHGRAVDCHAVGISLAEFWLVAERFPVFRGIGIYPFWANPGLHLDTRPTVLRKRWWRDSDGRYHPVTPLALRTVLLRK